MEFLFYFIVLWVADYLHFRLKYVRPDGPPVWYLFPFLGILPLYCLPKPLFRRIIYWYFENAPDVIITRFFFYPYILVKNSAIEEAQYQDKAMCRPRVSWLSSTFGYMHNREMCYFADGGQKGIPWQAVRKTNILALNIMPKQRKFEKTSDVVDHFVKTIDDQNGRVYEYENDLSFSKVQEACNVNLGKIFERNNVQTFVETIQGFRDRFSVILVVCTTIPLSIILMFERFLPKGFQPNYVRRMYSKLIRRFVEDRLEGANEAKDFFEAVLRLRKTEEAIEFFEYTLLVNTMASTHTTMHTHIATLSYVALDERVQKKIHEELDRVVGSAPLRYEHLNRLHYLKATIHEANRLNPPLPKMVRQTTDSVRIGGYTLPSNTTLMLYYYSENVNPKNFPNPDEFIPERFIAENGEFVKSKHFSIFSRGKRRCPAIEIANLSQEVHLAKILQHFTLIPKDTRAKVPNYGGGAFTEAPIVPVKFVRREGAPVIKLPELDSGLSAIVQEVFENESE